MSRITLKLFRVKPSRNCANKAAGPPNQQLQPGWSGAEGWAQPAKGALSKRTFHWSAASCAMSSLDHSLKHEIFILGRVPGFLPSVPNVCSLLPGHLDRKWSQDPVLVQMLNSYGNAFGWLTKDNPPLPLQSKDFSKSGSFPYCTPPQLCVNLQRKVSSPSLLSSPLILQHLRGRQYSNRTCVPLWNLRSSTSTMGKKESSGEQACSVNVGCSVSAD